MGLLKRGLLALAAVVGLGSAVEEIPRRPASRSGTVKVTIGRREKARRCRLCGTGGHARKQKHGR